MLLFKALFYPLPLHIKLKKILSFQVSFSQLQCNNNDCKSHYKSRYIMAFSDYVKHSQ